MADVGYELSVQDVTVKAEDGLVHVTWHRGELRDVTMRVDVEDALDLVTRLSGAVQDAYVQANTPVTRV